MAVDAGRAKDLVLAALGMPDAADRAAYLDRECGGDAELRARIDALLRAAEPPPVPPVGAAGASGPGARGTVDLTAGTSATATLDPHAPPPAVAATTELGPDGGTGTFGGTPPVRERPTAVELGMVIAGRYTLVELIGEGGMGSVYLASQT